MPLAIFRSMDQLRHLSCEDFSEFLQVEGAHEDIVMSFLNNRITGEAFLNLKEGDLKELVPVVGDRIFVRKLMQKAQEVPEAVVMVCQLFMCQYILCCAAC